MFKIKRCMNLNCDRYILDVVNTMDISQNQFENLSSVSKWIFTSYTMYLETSHLYVSDVSIKIKVLGPI